MHTHEDLREKRLAFLRSCKPGELREMRRGRRLDDHLDRKAHRCRERAQSLMAGGTFEGQAWAWAIREVLLETEAD